MLSATIGPVPLTCRGCGGDFSEFEKSALARPFERPTRWTISTSGPHGSVEWTYLLCAVCNQKAAESLPHGPRIAPHSLARPSDSRMTYDEWSSRCLETHGQGAAGGEQLDQVDAGGEQLDQVDAGGEQLDQVDAEDKAL